LGEWHQFAELETVPPALPQAIFAGWAATHLLEHLSNRQYSLRYNLINMNESSPRVLCWLATAANFGGTPDRALFSIAIRLN
jgi:hypothetical protein